jgi:hypothetical protein
MSNLRLTIPTIGTHLPALGGTLGAFIAYTDGSVCGLIVAPSVHEISGTWGKRGIDVSSARGIDGMASTMAMADTGSEIAQAVLALKVGGIAGWYIGSQTEMMVLKTCAPDLFDKKPLYWTSTQCSRSLAWAQDFEYGYSYDVSKGHEFRVRPLRCIQLQELQAFAPLAGEAGPEVLAARGVATAETAGAA